MAVEFGTECYCANKINTAQGAVPATDGRCKMPCGGDPTTICGGSYGLTVYTQGLPYVGCAIDTAGSGGGRTLSGGQLITSDMTPQKCIDFCATMNYALAGIEYGQECYCGSPTSLSIGASGCTSKCVGDASQTCGGSWRLSVYNNTAYVPPVVKPSIQGYTYRGCFADGAIRVLNNYVSSGPSMTQDTCVATCKSRGLSVAGLEYGKECWCGKTVPAPSTKADDGDCSYKCSGDSTMLCGGSYRLGVWAL
jgi:hypothetical protein